ncbi:MAG: hypothetical protein AAGK17_00125 [Pseudomonadota bacterium]
MKLIAKIAAMSAILLASATPCIAEETEGAMPFPSAGEFSPIERYNISDSRARDLAKFYLRSFGVDARQAEFEQTEHPSDPAKRIILIAASGLKDDSVQAIQLRLTMHSRAGQWSVTEAGIRRKCWRGDNTTQWQKELCP